MGQFGNMVTAFAAHFKLCKLSFVCSECTRVCVCGGGGGLYALRIVYGQFLQFINTLIIIIL